jgi:hypothetical protein
MKRIWGFCIATKEVCEALLLIMFGISLALMDRISSYRDG